MLCQQYRLPGGSKMEDRIMKKLGMLGIIGGAAILTAVPLSLQWSQKNVTLLLSSAEAQERPLTATSVAGVSRRAYRRAYRSAAYTSAAGYGSGLYSGMDVRRIPTTGYLTEQAPLHLTASTPAATP